MTMVPILGLAGTNTYSFYTKFFDIEHSNGQKMFCHTNNARRSFLRRVLVRIPFGNSQKKARTTRFPFFCVREKHPSPPKQQQQQTDQDLGPTKQIKLPTRWVSLTRWRRLERASLTLEPKPCSRSVNLLCNKSILPEVHCFIVVYKTRALDVLFDDIHWQPWVSERISLQKPWKRNEDHIESLNNAGHSSPWCLCSLRNFTPHSWLYDGTQ